MHLVFEPVNRFRSCGNEIQICRTSYQGIEITERSFFPWNPLKKSSFVYVPDLLIAEQDQLADFCRQRAEDYSLSDHYYTEPGFFLAECKTMEACLDLIEYFKSSNPNTTPVQ